MRRQPKSAHSGQQCVVCIAKKKSSWSTGNQCSPGSPMRPFLTISKYGVPQTGDGKLETQKIADATRLSCPCVGRPQTTTISSATIMTFPAKPGGWPASRAIGWTPPHCDCGSLVSSSPWLHPWSTFYATTLPGQANIGFRGCALRSATAYSHAPSRQGSLMRRATRRAGSSRCGTRATRTASRYRTTRSSTYGPRSMWTTS